jgi:hypothetical protein
MVATSATAILIDISLSALYSAFASVSPEGAVKRMQNRPTGRFSQVFLGQLFLTACVNRMVSAGPSDSLGGAEKRKCWKQSK